MPGERPRNAPDPAVFPIAHVHWALPPVTGGVETYLAEFTRALAGRGHPVTLFAGSGELNGWPRVETVPLDLLDLEYYKGERSAAEDEQLTKELAEAMGKELERRNIQVVHGHNLHYFTPIPALALERLREPLGLRLHHTYHSLWKQEGSDKSADSLRTCHSWPGQHTVSRYLRGACERELGVLSTHDSLGVAEDRYAAVPALAESVDEQVILLPARLVPEKGTTLALQALRALRDEGFSVRLVLTKPDQMVDWDHEGEQYMAEVQRSITEMKLRQYVDFCSVQHDEMPQLYATADVVIYPSIYPEPLGIAVLEAAASGRPTIVTHIGGLKETVVDGETGFVVPPGDLRALTDRLRSLLSDRSLARRLGAAGRARALAEFGLSAHVDRMVERYRRITG